MTKLATLILAASVALTASATALAADAAATLQVDAGSIMSSEGGEFTTARTGEVLVEGERLMVTEGATATVKYDNGCVRVYKVPGVYVIEANCEIAAAAGATGRVATGSPFVSAATLAAGVAAGAALLSEMDQVDAPAISR